MRNIINFHLNCLYQISKKNSDVGAFMNVRDIIENQVFILFIAVILVPFLLLMGNYTIITIYSILIIVGLSIIIFYWLIIPKIMKSISDESIKKSLENSEGFPLIFCYSYYFFI